jgi:hypothetical protein
MDAWMMHTVCDRHVQDVPHQCLFPAFIATFYTLSLTCVLRQGASHCRFSALATLPLEHPNLALTASKRCPSNRSSVRHSQGRRRSSALAAAGQPAMPTSAGRWAQDLAALVADVCDFGNGSISISAITARAVELLCVQLARIMASSPDAETVATINRLVWAGWCLKY